MADAMRVQIVSEDEWSARSGVVRDVGVEIRVQTPFIVDKGAKMEHDDGYEMGDDDVMIRGPVYVGDASMLDRHEELVDMSAIFSAWEGYAKNPVILYNHSKSNGVIGRMTDVEMGSWEGIEGEVPIGRAVIDGGEKDIVRKIRKGFLRAFSIGFIARAAVKECADEDKCYLRFTEIDWLETSVVDVPASPNALFSVEKHILGYEDMGDRIAILFEKPGDAPSEEPPAGGDSEAPVERSACKCGSDEKDEEEVSPIGTFSGDVLAFDERLSLVEAFIEAAEAEGIDADSFITPPEEQSGQKASDMTDAELIIKEAEAEAEAAELESEEVLEEATEEPVEEVLEEAPAEEVLEEAEEEVVEEKAADTEVVAILTGVVKALADLDSRLSGIESSLISPDLSDEVESLKATIAERDATIAALTEEKEAAEAEARIEAEVAKRVAAHVGDAPAAVVKTEASPKSLAPTTEVTVKNDVTSRDPTPVVSDGMKGLAAWLEAQVSRRGA